MRVYAATNVEVTMPGWNRWCSGKPRMSTRWRNDWRSWHGCEQRCVPHRAGDQAAAAKQAVIMPWATCKEGRSLACQNTSYGVGDGQLAQQLRRRKVMKQAITSVVCVI